MQAATKNKQRTKPGRIPRKKALYRYLDGRRYDEQKFYGSDFSSRRKLRPICAFLGIVSGAVPKEKSVNRCSDVHAMERHQARRTRRRNATRRSALARAASLSTRSGTSISFWSGEADLDKVLQIFIRINSGRNE